MNGSSHLNWRWSRLPYIAFISFFTPSPRTPKTYRIVDTYLPVQHWTSKRSDTQQFFILNHNFAVDTITNFVAIPILLSFSTASFSRFVSPDAYHHRHALYCSFYPSHGNINAPGTGQSHWRQKSRFSTFCQDNQWEIIVIFFWAPEESCSKIHHAAPHHAALKFVMCGN